MKGRAVKRSRLMHVIYDNVRFWFDELRLGIITRGEKRCNAFGFSRACTVIVSQDKTPAFGVLVERFFQRFLAIL